MRRWFVVSMALALAACTGQISGGDVSVEVATLGLSSLELGALQADRCVELRGSKACARYPNSSSCDRLAVSIRGDGSTLGRCFKAGQPTQLLSSVIEGIPVICRVRAGGDCVQCEDVYGGAVVDTCGDRQTQLFTNKGFPSDGTGFLPEPPSSGGQSPGGSGGSGPDQTAPPATGTGKCAPDQVKQAFVAGLNKLLKQEGFTFSWSPDLSTLTTSGLFGGQMGATFGAQACTTGGLGVTPKMLGCDFQAQQQGRCYCSEGGLFSSGVSCRCARMASEVLRTLCKSIPSGCDAKQWGTLVWRVHGAAVKYLNSGNPVLGGIPKPNATAGKTVGAIKGPDGIACLGSPLVLDLAGDGVELSPVGEGVSFDLLNHGPLRTAWPRGSDDALLALDRDGDGVIRSGSELFGEGTLVEGGPAADGFAALALLDRPDHGGNGNGLVDPGDLMFSQLVLWSDPDHDGVCRPGELRSLADAGVTALETRGRSDVRIVDGGGNDLSLRARFLRSGGRSGLLVDAMFVTRNR